MANPNPNSQDGEEITEEDWIAASQSCCGADDGDCGRLNRPSFYSADTIQTPSNDGQSNQKDRFA